MKSEPVDPADYDDIIELIEIAQKIGDVDKDAGDDAELDLFCNLMNSDTDEEQSPLNTNKMIVKKEVVMEPVAEPSAQLELQKASEEEAKKDLINKFYDFEFDVVNLAYQNGVNLQRHFDLMKVKKEPVNPMVQPEMAVLKLEEELLNAKFPLEASRRDHRDSRRHRDHRRDTRDRARDPGVMNGARFCLPRNDLAAEQRSRDDRRAAAVERERRRNDRRREDRRREERRQRRGHNDDDDRGRKRGGDRRDDEWTRHGDGKRRRD